MHALIYCSHAKQFWIKAQYRLDVRLPRLHPLTWTRDIVCDAQFSVEERAKIISVMWSIWHSHNRWTHDSEGYNPSHAIRHIRESLALLEVPLQQARVLPGHGWRPPEFGEVKINSDSAITYLME